MLETQDRRVGMRVLRDDDVPESEREADRVEVERADPRRVPLERVVHLGFGVATKRLVDEERGRVGEDQDHRDRNADRHPVPARAAQR